MTDRYRLHVDWLTSKAPHMRLDREVFEATAARWPKLADRLDVSYGTDLELFAEHVADCDFAIVQKAARGMRLDEIAPRLKIVHTTSAGIEAFAPLDWVPTSAAFTNNSGTHTPKMREYVMMALLMLQFEIPTLATQQREARWRQIFHPVIVGKTAVIVGFGGVGRAAAEAAKTLGLATRVVRRNPEPDALADAIFADDRLHEALDGADFLVIGAPLTPETRGLIGGAELDLLAPGAGVVNVGRGPILDMDALCRRLDDGRLSGAIVDVFEPEPLPAESPLWRQRNLVVTPHMSSDDPVSYVPRSLDIFFENFERFLEGRPLRNVVDPALGY